MQLRPYQNDIIEKTRNLMRQGVKSILLQSPTGSGKTLLTAHMLRTSAERGISSWFLVHRRELIKQSTIAFNGEGVTHGIVASGLDEGRTKLVQIASVQTMARRFHKYRVPSLIVWDECHHIAANSWAKIFSAFPNSFHIGLTATPERLDGKGLNKWFREMVVGPTVPWLIQNGYLSPYKLFAPNNLDLANVRTRMGDYVGHDLELLVDKPSITGDAIKHYRKHADGKRAVVFCTSIVHSKHVVQQFLDAGIPAAHVDGETESNHRDEAIRRFKDGEIKILSNVDLFGEGFDVPCIEAAILLRPTQSLGLYLQQVGRSLRPSPGKERAVILDHAGNCKKHGLPDEERVWDLNGRVKKEKNAEAPIRLCPECYAANYIGASECAECGYKFAPKIREPLHRDGDLVEVDTEAIAKDRKREQGSARTLQDLIKLGTKRKYKNPYFWAMNVIKHRTEKMVR